MMFLFLGIEFYPGKNLLCSNI